MSVVGVGVVVSVCSLMDLWQVSSDYCIGNGQQAGSTIYWYWFETFLWFHVYLNIISLVSITNMVFYCVMLYSLAELYACGLRILFVLFLYLVLLLSRH